MKQEKIKNIGISYRGRTFVGTVISTKMQKTAVVEWASQKFVSKYERYASDRSRVKVHIPENMKINDGDIVKIAETRKISKTKSFVIVEKVGEEKLFAEKRMLMEEAKKRQKEEHETTEIAHN